MRRIRIHIPLLAPLLTHLPEEPYVGPDGFGHGGIFDILQLILGTGGLYNFTNGRIMDMGDLGKEVVLNLKI